MKNGYLFVKFRGILPSELVKPEFFEQNYPPQKTNMAMENPRLEDVFPIEHGGFSNVM